MEKLIQVAGIIDADEAQLLYEEGVDLNTWKRYEKSMVATQDDPCLFHAQEVFFLVM